MEQEDSAEKAARKIRSKTRRRVARLWSAPGGEYPLPYCVKRSTWVRSFPDLRVSWPTQIGVWGLLWGI
jgi:hypothetical protein